MLELLIRHFFIIFCSIYVYIKIINKHLHIKNLYGSLLFFSLLLAFLAQGFSDSLSALKLPLTFLPFYVFITLYTKTKWHISFIISTISFAFSFASLACSSAISTIFLMLFFIEANPVNFLFVLMIGLLQFLLIYFIFKIKRLRNGMPFLFQQSIKNIGLVISTFIIILFFTLQIISLTTSPLRLILFITLTLAALSLLAWWRIKITQSYRKKLRVSEIESLYRDISDKDAEIERLLGNNNYLAKVIHKDNKVIPAMELAVRNYLQTAFTMKPEEAKEYGEDLLAQLTQMTADREGIIRDYRKEVTEYRPQIGLYPVDAVILYMEQRAANSGIDYRYQFDKGLKEVMLGYISEKDVIHLLSDVIENALIATMHASDKRIKIHIGFIQDILFIDVSDSGIAFEPSTYQDFGTIPHTTHADNGGSGIGLMDIWNLKKQYKISLQIYEYPPGKSVYTKKIRLLFDKKNHFLIQSYRSREIKSVAIRNDLFVFPYAKEDN